MKRMQRLVNIFQKILSKKINSFEFEDNNFFPLLSESLEQLQRLRKRLKKKTWNTTKTSNQHQ